MSSSSSMLASRSIIAAPLVCGLCSLRDRRALLNPEIWRRLFAACSPAPWTSVWTEAPREVLLASFLSGAETEIIVDPALLGEIVEVPREGWMSWPEPVKRELSDGRIYADLPTSGLNYS